MAKEIEKKFLIENIDALMKIVKNGEFVKCDIWQYYISDEVRVRVKICEMNGEQQDDYSITVKLGKGFTRNEYEYDIPREEGKLMIFDLQAQKKDFVGKTRYIFEYKGNVFELDVFKYENEGLKLLEVELENEDDKFELPPGVGEEVSDNERFYNDYLAKHPFSR